MDGIDELEPYKDAKGNEIFNMNTHPKLLIVTEDTFSEGGVRPDWMYNGSFLIFRKLEQDVKAFETLTKKFNTMNCENEEHMGAKLMGRWQSGEFHVAASIFHLVGTSLLADDSQNRCSTCEARIRDKGLEEPGNCEKDQRLHLQGSSMPYICTHSKDKYPGNGVYEQRRR